MILSDNNHNGGGSMMAYAESNSMPPLEPTNYCDMMHSSPADIPTFVAMLNDTYEISLSDKTHDELSNRLDRPLNSETEAIINSISDDEEPMDISDIPVKMERPNFLSISSSNYPVSHERFLSPERKGDVLLSDHKALPDINFFIKTPKKTTVFSAKRKTSTEIAGANQGERTIDHGATSTGYKSPTYLDLEARTLCEAHTGNTEMKAEENRPIEFRHNECSVTKNHEQKISNFHNTVKCESRQENFPCFASSQGEMGKAHPTSDPIIEQYNVATLTNYGFRHSLDSAFCTPHKYCTENPVFLGTTYTRSSPQYFPVDNRFLSPNHEFSDSSYSTSPCSISSNLSCCEANSPHSIIPGVIAHTGEGPQDSPTLKETVAVDKAKMTCNSDDSYYNLEHGTSMASYMDEILNEVIRNVEVACIQLQLSADPKLWTEEQVQNWVNWTIDQYKLPSCGNPELGVTGRDLCELSESEIRALAPECGDFLHAHLEIWRTDSSESRGALQELQKAEDAIAVMTPNHTAGIHLWQFLKELLLQPHLYGKYIRWIDKETGIFKIEDSVEVARLWGIRKNRPAMNYDKLSRSIRQYYKKGIIKKTEVSQRLVYQFVKPIA